MTDDTNTRPSSSFSIFEPDQNPIQNEDDDYQKHNIKTEQNCFPVTSATVSHYENTNKKGRPRKGNGICFGPQPQSMISKLLSKMKADCNIELATKKHDCHNVALFIPSTPICSQEPDHTEDDDHPKKTKRRKKSKKAKDATKPKIYSCDFENCLYSTKLTSNMIKHKRVHTGEKPYLCDRCSFRSNFINSLKCHKRLHTEVRPYKCSECDYSCNSISNLKKHRHTRHKTSNC